MNLPKETKEETIERIKNKITENTFETIDNKIENVRVLSTQRLAEFFYELIKSSKEEKEVFSEESDTKY